MNAGRGLDDLMRADVPKKESREDEKALHPIAGVNFEEDILSLKEGKSLREPAGPPPRAVRALLKPGSDRMLLPGTSLRRLVSMPFEGLG